MNREVFGFLVLGIAMLFVTLMFFHALASMSKSNDEKEIKKLKKS
jgi:hypothetical protein